jgi:hypothetical protein
MSNIDNSGPAFPVVEVHPVHGSRVDVGMSLRDYFAGLAFTQLVHRREMTEGATYSKPELAAEAYAYADVLLKARKNQLASEGE